MMLLIVIIAIYQYVKQNPKNKIIILSAIDNLIKGGCWSSNTKYESKI